MAFLQGNVMQMVSGLLQHVILTHARSWQCCFTYSCLDMPMVRDEPTEALENATPYLRGIFMVLLRYPVSQPVERRCFLATIELPRSPSRSTRFASKSMGKLTYMYTRMRRTESSEGGKGRILVSGVAVELLSPLRLPFCALLR